ncbi:hypothetical protein AGMMS49942_22670 [Spirochaetia bacterium]|nr:hypothetical protein AGMMS49942_22670 [Spirochaetia bacterium]
MIYSDNDNDVIKSMEDWQRIFTNTKKEKHWKEGRSAYSIANFMLNCNGEEKLVNSLKIALNMNIHFDKATPELEVRFDSFGHGREHDLGIWGHTDDNKKVFIGIESKVDEPFDDTIGEEYLEGKANELSGERTNKVLRIENLLKKSIVKITKKTFDLRYQLLTAVFGTIAAEDNGVKADYSIMVIIVFKTKLYDDEKGKQNYKDFCNFIKEVPAMELNKNDSSEAYSLKIDNKDLDLVYLTFQSPIEK